MYSAIMYIKKMKKKVEKKKKKKETRVTGNGHLSKFVSKNIFATKNIISF